MKKIVVVDIDGTIAQVGDRLKYLQLDKPDYDKFYDSCFEDKPINEIVDLVKILSNHYIIIFLTGRREQVRDITHKWLCDRNLKGELIMRPNKDHRHDTQVKIEQFIGRGYSISDVAFVLEDRNSMVDRWRELGVKCLQVAYGNF